MTTKIANQIVRPLVLAFFLSLLSLSLTGSAFATAPVVTSFTPSAGPVGTSVSITGTSFTGATAVKFNTTSATVFSVVSSTSISATVPTGATTGKISVTTSGGTGTSTASFTIAAAPTSLAATSGSGQVSLTWTAGSGDVNYAVFQGTTAGGEGSTPVVTGLSSPSAVVTGLTNGSTYFLTVKAYVGSAYTAASNEVSAVPLGAPSALAATPGTSTVALSWTAAAGATGYNVYRGTSAGGESATVLGTSTTTSYTDSTAANNTTYFYIVKGTKSPSVGPASNEVSAKPFAAPTSLVATAGNGQIGLTWTAGSGDVSYNIFRGTSAGGESGTALGTSTSASYTDTTAVNGSTYYYTVKANVGTSLSAATNEVSGTPHLTPPTSPAATASGLTITTTWAAVSNATGYNVYRGTSAGGESTTAINSSPVSALTYTDSSGLSAATKYYYKLKSVSATDTSPTYSTEVSATTAPAAPTNVVATVQSTTSIKLTWTASTAATSYLILRSPDGSTSWTQVGSTSSTSFTNTGLSPSLTYYYEVEASNTGGASPPSAVVNATLSPAAPTGVTATAGVQQVMVAWAQEGSCTYTVSRGIATGGPYTSVAVGLTTTTFTDTGLNARAYFYVVTATNSVATSSKSSEVSAIPTGPNGTVVMQIDCDSSTGVPPYAADTLPGSGFPPTSTTSYVNLNGVVNPAPEAVYQTADIEGGGPGAISGLQPNTAYTVRLHFAEIGSSPFTYNNQVLPGMRVFNVLLNGVQVLTNFDISAVAGGSNTAIVEQFNCQSDSTGKITFVEMPVLAALWYGVYPIINGFEMLTGSSAPSAPYGLTAAVNNTQVTLNWVAVNGATSYNVYRSNLSGNETLDQSGVSATTLTETIPDNSQTYYYVVTAVNSFGESGKSNEANTTAIQCSAPPVPQNFIATISGNNDVSLQWYGVDSSAAYYKVYGSFNVTGPYTVFAVQQGVGRGTYYMNNGGFLGAGTYMYVTSVSSCGAESAPSDFQKLVYGDYAIPQGGIGKIPTGSSTTNCPATGTWDVLNLAGAVLGTSIEPNGWNVTDDTSGNIIVTVPDTAQISSFNTVRIERPSSSICDSQIFDITSFPSPQITATAGNGQVTLSWAAINGATHYNVYRNSTNANTFFYVASPTTNSYVDTGLNNGTQYFYVVTAASANTESPPSNVASATPNGPVTVPTLSATSATNGVELDWNAADGSPTYNLYRGVTRSGEGTSPYVSGITATTYFDTAVVPGTEYYYFLTAVAGGTENYPSNEVFGGIIGFSVTATPTTITIARGSTAAVPVTVTSSGGFQGQVVLSTSGLPSDYTNYWSYPNNLNLYPTAETVYPVSPIYAANVCTSNLYISAGQLETPGTYSVTITGTSGSYSNSQTITVIIQ